MVDVNGQEEPVLIFVHIPKAGGVTMNHIIERHFSAGETCATCHTRLHPDGTLDKFDALGEAELARIKLLNGHMGYGLHKRLPRPAQYITFLRQPIERVISHYSFERTLPDSPVYEPLQSGEMDLMGYVRYYAEAGEWDNLQTRMIAGNWHKRGYGPCTPEMLETAKHNLQENFAVVGLTERFDESYLLVKRHLGWPLEYFMHRNKTRKRVQREDVSAEELECVRRHNLFDLELYEFARELFERQVREAGASFPVELAWLRLGNRLYRQYRQMRTFSVRTFVRNHSVRTYIRQRIGRHLA